MSATEARPPSRPSHRRSLSSAPSRPSAADPPDPPELREQVRRHCGFDPGPLTAEARLDDLGLAGLARLRLVAGLEASYRIDLPADLVSALDTVDELLGFVGIKIDQQTDHGGGDAA